ncbi:hypothetical protein LZL87_005280 [Fusarium oxysporum]|uniref:Uncharacterized protein n=1 Tax=Fusarium oxysporum f. sp. rapae TaxID=485398 RepID=A0A8J5U4L0_FUSOX|nr:hypothetical protein Forpe1208_v000564 [Fusarium oxysporum f. sp. rapae]KAI7772555.1 hypothetical protein LZL87_005280 [Fusarium oxysporum]
MGKHEGESSGASKGKMMRYGRSGKATYVYHGPPTPPVFRWDQLDPKTMTVSDFHKISDDAIDEFRSAVRNGLASGYPK